jgi:hypothetical protein
MKINEEIMKQWSELRSHGDVKTLSRLAKVSRVTIYKALQGEASYKLIKIINNYYKQKKQTLCKLSEQ